MNELKTEIIGCRITKKEREVVKRKFGSITQFIRQSLDKIPEIKKLNIKGLK